MNIEKCCGPCVDTNKNHGLLLFWRRRCQTKGYLSPARRKWRRWRQWQQRRRCWCIRSHVDHSDVGKWVQGGACVWINWPWASHWPFPNIVCITNCLDKVGYKLVLLLADSPCNLLLLLASKKGTVFSMQGVSKRHICHFHVWDSAHNLSLILSESIPKSSLELW